LTNISTTLLYIILIGYLLDVVNAVQLLVVAAAAADDDGDVQVQMTAAV